MVALKEIREKLLVKQKQYLRAISDECIAEMSNEQLLAELERLNETDGTDINDSQQMRAKLKEVERTRHLMIWLDNSTVANSGYLVCLVTCLYDPGVYYTDDEFKQAFGKNVNIQKIIEEPEIHFIAKCGSSDSEQLLYCEERLKCIVDLKHKCTEQISHIEYTDKMRFCHGDSPLRAFEAGQQKGGNYFCCSCGIHCDMVYCLDHALNCEFTSLDKRQKAILQGPVGRRNSRQKKSKPFNGLSKGELEQELASRQIYSGKTKDELKGLLVESLQGKQRVPALLITNPETSLSDFGLENYEILPCEPLHDVGHHIENVFTELPNHLPHEESRVIEESISLCLAGKESKRCVDYRMALIKTAAVAHQSGKVSKKVLDVIDTLVEMQRILYADDNCRTPAQILRYYNQAWYHSILLHDFIVNNPKKLTTRKMFGVYFHNLSAHAGDMLRIISGQSANAERQERIFNSIKRITKQTSNYHPGHIIPNLFVRLQAEKELGLQGNDSACQQAQVSNLAKSLPPLSNTVIPISIIKKHSSEWQAHLQHISDFLVEGEGIWWNRSSNGVEFYDVSKSPDLLLRGPKLHHFRSSTLSQEERYLTSCWNMCVEERKVIPLHVIRIDQEDGTTKRIHTPYLGDPVPDFPNIPLSMKNCDEEEKVSVEDEEITPEITPPENDYTSGESQSTDEEIPQELSPAKCNYFEESSNIIEIHPSPDETVNFHSDQITCKNPQPPVQEQTAISKQMKANNAQTTSPIPEDQALRSSLCRAIEVVLGPTKELFSLDKTHIYLKELKRQKRADIGQESKYSEELAHFQVRVLAERSNAQTMLIDWERNYTINNGLIAPTQDQIKSDNQASILLKRLKYANGLLKEWKIDFSK